MLATKVFKSGNSYAVRLPKEYKIDSKEINIKKCGDIILLIPKNHLWKSFADSLDMFTDDFMDKRDQGTFDEREAI